MLRVTCMLAMIVGIEALNMNMMAGMSNMRLDEEEEETKTPKASGFRKDNSEEPISTEHLPVNLEGKERKATIEESGTNPKDATPAGSNGTQTHDLSDHDHKGFGFKDSTGGMARSQSWETSKQSEGESRGVGMQSGILVIFLIGCAMFGAYSMSSAVKHDKSGQEMTNMTPMVSSVSLGVKPKAPPAALPQGLQEVDVLETFDSFDKKRRGFIEADILEGLLGPDASAQQNAAKVVGNVDKLFYHDFRKLVLQKGPVQDAVVNMASRKRGSPLNLASAK